MYRGGTEKVTAFVRITMKPISTDSFRLIKLFWSRQGRALYRRDSGCGSPGAGAWWCPDGCSVELSREVRGGGGHIWFLIGALPLDICPLRTGAVVAPILSHHATRRTVPVCPAPPAPCHVFTPALTRPHSVVNSCSSRRGEERHRRGLLSQRSCRSTKTHQLRGCGRDAKRPRCCYALP